MNTNDQKKIDDLEKAIDEYMKSGKTMPDFIKQHIFKEYTEGGDKNLEEIAAEFFLDHLK